MNKHNKLRLYACAGTASICAAYMALTPSRTDVSFAALVLGAAMGFGFDLAFSLWDRIDLRTPGSTAFPIKATIVYIEAMAMLLGFAFVLDQDMHWYTGSMLWGFFWAIAGPALFSERPSGPGSGMARLPRVFRWISVAIAVVFAVILAIAIPLGILAWVSFLILTGHAPGF